MRPSLGLLLLVLCPACSREAAEPATPADAAPAEVEASETASPPAEAAGEAPVDAADDVAAALELMRARIALVNARPEHGAAHLKVRHILISYQGGVPNVARPREKAQELAALTYAELAAGADFSELMRERSDDQGSEYGMFMGTPVPNHVERKGMVPSFGDVAWRLEVGEIGIAPLDPRKSRWGWHIIQRIE